MRSVADMPGVASKMHTTVAMPHGSLKSGLFFDDATRRFRRDRTFV
jgi:hypothetical protein